jgi:hypothetical protein
MFPLRRLHEQVKRRHVVGEARQRPFALEPQRGPRLVQRSALLLLHHRDVLAEAFGAGADQAHVGGHAVELCGEDRMQAVVLARLDHEREVCKPRPQRLYRRPGTGARAGVWHPWPSPPKVRGTGVA